MNVNLNNSLSKLLADIEMQRRIERVVEPIFYIDMILNIQENNNKVKEAPLFENVSEDTNMEGSVTAKKRKSWSMLTFNKQTSRIKCVLYALAVREDNDDDSAE